MYQDELQKIDKLVFHGKLTYRFSEAHLDTLISFDFTYKFNPFYPRTIYITDNNGKETIMLADEYSIM